MARITINVSNNKKEENDDEIYDDPDSSMLCLTATKILQSSMLMTNERENT